MCAAIASISVVYDSVAATTLLLVIASAAVLPNRAFVWTVFAIVSVAILCMQDTRTASPHLFTAFALLMSNSNNAQVQTWQSERRTPQVA